MTRRRPRRSHIATVAVLAVAASFAFVGVGVVPLAEATTACPTGTTPVGTTGCRMTVSYSGSLKPITVHSGFSEVWATLVGGLGGSGCDTDQNGGGAPDGQSGQFPVTTGEVLTVLVGGAGHQTTSSDCPGVANDAAGGFGGGGAGDAAGVPGGGGGSFLWAGDTLELVGGGGGSAGQPLGFGGAGGPEVGLEQDEGGNATASAPGVAGGGSTPGHPGTGPASSTSNFGVGGASVSVDDPDNPGFTIFSGAGGGGYNGGGSGGCLAPDNSDQCGGGGAGASFSASNVAPAGSNPVVGDLTGNGTVVLTFLFGCPTPSFTLVRGTRVSGTGLATLQVDANVGDPTQCGTPELQLTGDGVGRAHFQGNVKLQMISQGVAQAKRDFPAAESCWITGTLTLTQTQTGHAARTATDSVATVPKPDFKIAKAKRSAKGVSAEVEAISLPPVSHCGKAKLLLNGASVARLKSKTDSQTGDDLVVKGLRLPVSDECLKKLHFKAVPNDSAGSDAKRAVRVTGDGKNVLTVCRKG